VELSGIVDQHNNLVTLCIFKFDMTGRFSCLSPGRGGVILQGRLEKIIILWHYTFKYNMTGWFSCISPGRGEVKLQGKLANIIILWYYTFKYNMTGRFSCLSPGRGGVILQGRFASIPTTVFTVRTGTEKK
jgi:hypothetical protein